MLRYSWAASYFNTLSSLLVSEAIKCYYGQQTAASSLQPTQASMTAPQNMHTLYLKSERLGTGSFESWHNWIKLAWAETELRAWKRWAKKKTRHLSLPRFCDLVKYGAGQSIEYDYFCMVELSFWAKINGTNIVIELSSLQLYLAKRYNNIFHQN